MSNDSGIVRIPGFFRGKIVKVLTFTSDGLTIEKPLSFDPVIDIAAERIVAFRYGVNWVRGYKFPIGRQYLVEILDADNHITRINLKSVYGIKRRVYGDIWRDIVNQLWSHYFHDKLTGYFNHYQNGEPFDLAGIEFSSFGIKLDNKCWLWDEFALSNYRTYFVVHNKTNLQKKRSFSFSNDWNALLLQSLLKAIVNDQKEKVENTI